MHENHGNPFGVVELELIQSRMAQEMPGENKARDVEGAVRRAGYGEGDRGGKVGRQRNLTTARLDMFLFQPVVKAQARRDAIEVEKRRDRHKDPEPGNPRLSLEKGSSPIVAENKGHAGAFLGRARLEVLQANVCREIHGSRGGRVEPVSALAFDREAERPVRSRDLAVREASFPQGRNNLDERMVVNFAVPFAPGDLARKGGLCRAEGQRQAVVGTEMARLAANQML